MSCLQWVEFVAVYLAALLVLGVPFALGLFLILLAAHASVAEWWLRRRAIKVLQARGELRP